MKIAAAWAALIACGFQAFAAEQDPLAAAALRIGQLDFAVPGGGGPQRGGFTPAAFVRPTRDRDARREQEEARARMLALRQAVVTISDGTSIGSGFFIDPGGLILTNAHVAKDAQTVAFKAWRRGARCEEGDRGYPQCWEGTARVLASAGGRDIAVLQVEDDFRDWEALCLAGDPRRVCRSRCSGRGCDPHVPDPVVTIGNTQGFGPRVIEGTVSMEATQIDPYQRRIQFDSSANHGNSGGPLVDIENRVVGMMVAVLGPPGGGDTYDGMTYAIPVSELLRTLADYEAAKAQGLSGNPLLLDVAPQARLDSASLTAAYSVGGLPAGDAILSFDDALGRRVDLGAVPPEARAAPFFRDAMSRRPGAMRVEVVRGLPAVLTTRDPGKPGAPVEIASMRFNPATGVAVFDTVEAMTAYAGAIAGNVVTPTSVESVRLLDGREYSFDYQRAQVPFFPVEGYSAPLAAPAREEAKLSLVGVPAPVGSSPGASLASFVLLKGGRR